MVFKDGDGVRLASLLGQPPKRICLRVRNCTTERMGPLLLGSQHVIKKCLSDPVESVHTLE